MKLEQPQAIRTIFFDAGFTLLRPYPSTLEIYHKVCRQLELEITLEHLAYINSSEHFYLSQSQANPHTWADEADITAFWIAHHTRLLTPLLTQDAHRIPDIALAIHTEFAQHTSWQIYPDVIPTLETFRAHGYTLGIISDWGLALGTILNKLGLTTYFDCLLVSAATRLAKPSPQLYTLALERANAIPDYSLHIGDSYIHDVLGARAAGITPVLLDRHQRLKQQRLDCILVHSLDELLDILEVPKRESKLEKS